MTEIRAEREADGQAVHGVNESAFETGAEASLVEKLRASARPLISLVAVEDNAIVGHILFTPVTLSDHDETKIMGLAPMAVLPSQQNQGIGSKLVRAGLEHCKRLEFGAVVVLGHPTYYPRFGFVPSVKFNIKSEYDVPDDVFMAMELEPGYLGGKSGTIKFHPEFNNL